MSQPRARLGARAEELACSHLQQAGYTLVLRNWRVPQGEIDIIAHEAGVLAFVEVRARSHSRCVQPLETITRAKQQRIICAARAYISGLRGPWPPMRFDALGIVLPAAPAEPSYTLVRGAFVATDG